jgi:hypothetical protein
MRSAAALWRSPPARDDIRRRDPPAHRPSLRAAGRCASTALLRVAACALLLAGAGATCAQQEPRIDVRRDGPVFYVLASADIAAEPRVVWDTLTDYERLYEFLPGVEGSRVVARDGQRLTVEHRGAFRMFLYERPVRLRLAVEHEPFARIVARSTPGLVGSDPQTLRSFYGRYGLTVVGGSSTRVRLDYDAQFELVDPLPPVIGPLFGAALVRATMREHFEAMLREIRRRQAQQPRIGKGGG